LLGREDGWNSPAYELGDGRVARVLRMGVPSSALLLLFVFVGLSGLVIAGMAQARSEADGPPAFCDSAERCRATLDLRAGGHISYYRSHPLENNDTIKRAVIVIHGNGRDGDRYFERLVEAARIDGPRPNAILLAPHFQTLKDGPSKREHYWSSGGWKIGHRSRDAGRVSSFTIVDELLGRICSKSSKIFTQLETVVLIGHSAGGQFVNRYAAGGKGCPDSGIETRYVVMNPSSYLYVDARRRSEPGGDFQTSWFGCRGYDDYKYGLGDLNTYMKRVGVDVLRKRLFTRKTYYLAGTADTKLGGSLDTRCEANRQGANRLVRHANYRDYTGLFDEWAGAEFLLVPEIGHSSRKMLRSEVARRVMFE
jgi:hypothetical protein